MIISIKRFKASAQKSCNSSHRYPLMHILLGLLNLQGNCTIASHHWTTTLQTVKQWCEKDVNGKWLIQRLSTLSWQQAKTKENIKLHVQLWTALLNSCTFFYFLLQVRGCQSNFVLFFQNKLSVQILNPASPYPETVNIFYTSPQKHIFPFKYAEVFPLLLLECIILHWLVLQMTTCCSVS